MRFSDRDPTKRGVGSRVALAVAAIFLFNLAVWSNITNLIFGDRYRDAWNAFTSGHFAAVVGLPMAAALAFIIVLLLPATYGEIEFKVVGISFKGASGPIVYGRCAF
jgi:hypothetical protein